MITTVKYRVSCMYTLATFILPPTLFVFIYRCSLCHPKFVVENADGDAIFTIDGPFCPCQYIFCYGDIEFSVVDVFRVMIFSYSYFSNKGSAIAQMVS